VESRIKRLESVLTASGIDPAQFDESEPTTKKEKEKDDVTAEVTDNLSTLLISKSGTSRFIGMIVAFFIISECRVLNRTSGPSSGFSLFSPQGLKWISDRTGTNEIKQFIQTLAGARENPWPVSRSTDLFHTMSPMEREPLPSKETADVFVDCKCSVHLSERG
jgi:hypothetical protein